MGYNLITYDLPPIARTLKNNSRIYKFNNLHNDAMEHTNYIITNNTTNKRFEVLLDDNLAFLEYRIHDGTIALMHTEVPEILGGKGIAGALAAYAFNYAKENNLPVIVYCPFVLTYLKRHPEYQSQVITKTHNS